MGLSDRSSDSRGNSSSGGQIFDNAGNIAATLSDIILRGQLVTFASDKTGCQSQLCGDVFANFFLQHMISQAAKDACGREMQLFVDSLKRHRQPGAQQIPLAWTGLVPDDRLAGGADEDEPRAALRRPKRQSRHSEDGCRVSIRLVVPSGGASAVGHVADHRHLGEQDALCLSLLRDLMSAIMLNCTRMAFNEFTNYVVQHIIQTPLG
ncbi:hypothetical protein WR25_26810 [Diploscapter pachys]|uniref:Uncharacterized protein n=1 Tax=Diploscapter pachys TaxID=2018661 RepID=A0A2A2KKY0_9BILA|nr:hypothetical protein WR25_26810 [Diploscapter pachys]